MTDARRAEATELEAVLADLQDRVDAFRRAVLLHVGAVQAAARETEWSRLGCAARGELLAWLVSDRHEPAGMIQETLRHVAPRVQESALLEEASAIMRAAGPRAASIADAVPGAADAARMDSGRRTTFDRLPPAGQAALVKRVVENPGLLWDTARRLAGIRL